MHWKTLFDRYYCINSTICSHKLTKSMALYFVATSQTTGGWTFSWTLSTRAKRYIKATNRSAVVKYSWLAREYHKVSNMCIYAIMMFKNYSASCYLKHLHMFKRKIMLSRQISTNTATNIVALLSQINLHPPNSENRTSFQFMTFVKTFL